MNSEPPASNGSVVDASAFKEAMQQLAATVSVIAHDINNPAGLTATAVMSLSASPPSIVISVNRVTGFHARLRPGELLSVNLLANHQQDVCRAFGGGQPGQTRFQTGRWNYDDPRAPYLADAIATLFCRVDQLVDYATHTLVLANVVGYQQRTTADPLVYLRGGFYALQATREVWGMPF